MCLQQGGATLLSPSVCDAFFFCCFLVTFAAVGRHSCRPAFAMHSFYLSLWKLPLLLLGDRSVVHTCCKCNCNMNDIAVGLNQGMHLSGK